MKRYLTRTWPVEKYGMPLFAGDVIDATTKQIVWETTMMSEEYLNQVLDNHIRKLERDNAKSEKIERERDSTKVHDDRGSGDGPNS